MGLLKYTFPNSNCTFLTIIKSSIKFLFEKNLFCFPAEFIKFTQKKEKTHERAQVFSFFGRYDLDMLVWREFHIYY